MVRVPTVDAEDARQLHRLRETLQRERNRAGNRLQGLLATQGLRLKVQRDFPTHLEAARLWDGTPVPHGLQQRLLALWAQLQFLTQQLREHGATRNAESADANTRRWAERLHTLRAIGVNGAWVLATEIFAWRQIRNRRELAALVGVVPAPYQSGDIAHDQGITRALGMVALSACQRLSDLVSPSLRGRRDAVATDRHCGTRS